MSSANSSRVFKNLDDDQNRKNGQNFDEHLQSLLDRLLEAGDEVFQKLDDTFAEMTGKFKIILGVEVALLTANILSFILTIHFCKSLIKNVFILKAIALIFVNLMKIADISFFLSHGTLNHENSYGDDSYDYEMTVSDALKEIFEKLFMGFHQYASLLLLYELHNLVVVVEIRQHVAREVLIKSLFGFVPILLILGLDRGISEALSIATNIVYKDVLIQISPIYSLVTLTFSLFIAYYAYKIHLALRGSDNFRQICAQQSKGDHSFLAAAVTLMAICQFIKYTLQVVFGVMKSYQSKTFAQTESLLSAMPNTGWYELYFIHPLGYFTEDVGMISLMIYKRFKHKS